MAVNVIVKSESGESARSQLGQTPGIWRAYTYVLWTDQSSGKRKSAMPGNGQPIDQQSFGRAAPFYPLRAFHDGGVTSSPPTDLPTRERRQHGMLGRPKARLLRGKSNESSGISWCR